MKRQTKQWFLALGLLSALTGMLPSALTWGQDLELIGLAMHRETGRDIYLGAMRAERPLASPADIVTTAGAREMEFRIVARRTSIRSILGGILLQAEVANDVPPPPDIVDFANGIMSAVQGSLYTSDSFGVRDNGQGQTIATANGQELTRTSADGVFNYFLSGWVGERGASTAFRNSLLAMDIAVGLRADYGAYTPSAERIAAVRAWAGKAAEPEQPAVVASTEPAADPAPEPALPAPQQQNTTTAQTQPVVAEISPSPAPAANVTPHSPSPMPAAAVSAVAGTGTGTGAIQEELVATTPAIATANIKPEMRDDKRPAEALASEREPEHPDNIQGLSVIEYSQRLAAFNSMVFRMVNTRIRYPRAAIRRDIQGQLELDITLDSQGELLEVAVARSSGHSMLDKAALKAANTAFDNPLGDPLDHVALAEYGDGEQLIIPVPVNFVLTE